MAIRHTEQTIRHRQDFPHIEGTAGADRARRPNTGSPKTLPEPDEGLCFQEQQRPILSDRWQERVTPSDEAEVIMVCSHANKINKIGVDCRIVNFLLL